jgi:uncharacterized protein YbjT (DUF2867 family)
MKIVVFGAGGKVGRLVVPLLVDSGHDVTGVIHGEHSAAGVTQAGATPVIIDLEGDVAPVRDVLQGADTVLWTAGADFMTGPEHSDRLDRDGNLRAIAAGAEAGVKWWIQVSSLFADRIELAPPMLAHFLGNKVAADDAARASGMNYTVVRPGGLLDDPGAGTVDIVAEGMVNARVTRADVADVISVLINNELAVNTSFDLGSGNTAPEAALRAL